jgi:hypothetical protein
MKNACYFYTSLTKLLFMLIKFFKMKIPVTKFHKSPTFWSAIPRRQANMTTLIVAFCNCFAEMPEMATVVEVFS